jgi:hypothetical protein
MELKEVLAAERAEQPFLLFRDGDATLVIFTLAGDTVTIGRGEGPDVRLDWDDTVSGVHAELTAVGGHWAIADDGLSRNGTLVNNQPLRGRQRLRGGDIVRAGNTTLAFHDGAAGTAPAPTAIADAGGPVHVTPAQHRVLVALCRPYRERAGFVTPATNQQIADELVVSVEAVKTQLRVLYGRVGVDHLAQNEKRARLAERALELGLVAVNEL